MPQSLAGGTTVFLALGRTSSSTLSDAREPATERRKLGHRPSIHWCCRFPCWNTATATVQPTSTSADRHVSGRCRVAKGSPPMTP